MQRLAGHHRHPVVLDEVREHCLDLRQVRARHGDPPQAKGLERCHHRRAGGGHRQLGRRGDGFGKPPVTARAAHEADGGRSR